MTLKSIQEYGPKFQVKVLSSLLTHKEFLVNIYDILNEEDFNNQAHRWIVKEIIQYYPPPYQPWQEEEGITTPLCFNVYENPKAAPTASTPAGGPAGRSPTDPSSNA